MADNGSDAKDSLGERLLGSEQLYDMLITKISDVAVERIEAQQSRTRNRAAIFVTVLVTVLVAALTGIATLGLSALRESLSDQLLAAAEKQVVEATKAAVEERVPLAVSEAVRAQVLEAQTAWTELTELNNLTNKLRRLNRRIEENQAFSNEEANDAIDTLIRPSKSEVEIDQYKDLLEDFIDQFQAADRDDFVQKLEVHYQHVMLEELGIVYTMVDSLGKRLAGFLVPPAKLEGSLELDRWKKVWDRYLLYADAARTLSYPEYPFPYDLIVANMIAEPKDVIEARVRGLGELKASEREFVLEAFTRLVSESWRATPDAFSSRVRERARTFLDRHARRDRTGTLPLALEYAKTEPHRGEVESALGGSEKDL